MRAQDRPADFHIADLAARQYGVVARPQLESLGLDRGQIARRLQGGRLHRIHRGVFAVGHARLTKAGWWMAAVLACGPGAVLSHTTAGAAHAIAGGRGIHVASPTRSRHGIPGLILHQPRGLRPHEVTEVDGIPCTSVTRTLVDLATVFDYGQLKRAWQAAQRQRTLDVNAIAPYLDQPRKGIRKLRTLYADATDAPDTKGEFEDRFADFLDENPDIEKPVFNALIHGYLVDAAWIHQQLIVELDSREYHWHRREEDTDRDADLLTKEWRVYRVTWRALTTTPDTVASRLRRLLRTAPSPTRAVRAGGA